MRSFYPARNVVSATRKMLKRARTIEPRFRYSWEGKPIYGLMLPLGRQELAKDIIRLTVNDLMIQRILLKRNQSLITQLKLNQENKQFLAMTASKTAEKIANYATGKYGGNKEKAIKYLKQLENEISEFGHNFPIDELKELALTARKKGLSEDQTENYKAYVPHAIGNIQQYQILDIVANARHKIADSKVKGNNKKEQ